MEVWGSLVYGESDICIASLVGSEFKKRGDPVAQL